MGIKVAWKPKEECIEDIVESINIHENGIVVDKLLEKRSDSYKKKWHKMEAQLVLSLIHI